MYRGTGRTDRSQSTMKKEWSSRRRSSGARSTGSRAERSSSVSRARPAAYSSICSSSTGVKFTVTRTPGWRSSIHAMSL